MAFSGDTFSLLHRFGTPSRADINRWLQMDADLADIATGASALAARITALRQVLTGNRTYYVRADGSDSNTGLADTAGGAFLTIQKGIDAAAALDLSIYSVTVQVGSGTYSAGNTLKSYVGAGPINIRGDTTTPSNVVISSGGSDCFAAAGTLGIYDIRGFKLQTTGGYGIQGSKNAQLQAGNVEFGAMSSGGVHQYTKEGATITWVANYSVTGAPGNFHSQSNFGGRIITQGITVTLTGTPNVGIWSLCQNLSHHQWESVTFSGTATGQRYNAQSNSVINTVGAGATALPGNAGGSTATGGQYI